MHIYVSSRISVTALAPGLVRMNRHPPVSDANQVAEGTTFIAMPSYPLEVKKFLMMRHILHDPHFFQSIADEMQAPIGLHVRNNSQLFEYPFVHRQHMSAITLGGLMMVVSLFENSLLGFIGGATLTFGCRCVFLILYATLGGNI
jgi:hypothetical protein